MNTFDWRRKLLVLVALVPPLLIPLSRAQTNLTTPNDQSHWNKLRSGEDVLNGLQASPSGRTPVIVNLAKPDMLNFTDWKSEDSRRSHRKSMLALKQPLLDTLTEPEALLRERFENQPAFSAEVTLDALEKLLKDPRVESVQPVRVMKKHTAQGIPLINGMAYRSTYFGQGVSVAICDDGVDYRHPRLGGGGFPNSKVIGGFNFGDNNSNPLPTAGGHGTACAGISAGNLDAFGDYIGGVAPGAKIYALKVSAGTLDTITDDKIISSWNWCVTHQNDNGANPILVVSCSVGEGRYYASCDNDLTAFRDAANNLANAGITLVCSSGNDGYCDSIAAPSCLSKAIATGAVFDTALGIFDFCVDPTSCAAKNFTLACDTRYQAQVNTSGGLVTPYCNIASILTVLAPAENAYTLDIVGSSGGTSSDYNPYFGGTSAAAPYVAGAVAALQSAAHSVLGRYLSPDEVRSKLTTYGTSVSDPKSGIVKPLVNVGAMINSFGGPGNVTLTSPSDGQSFSAGSVPQFSWQQNGNAAQWYYIYVMRSSGKYFDLWTQSTSLSAGVPPPGGNYTWWVRPWNAAGFGDWSSAGHFSIQTCIPASIGLVSPQGTVSPSSTMTYTWNPDSCASWYELAVIHNGGLFVDQWFKASDLSSQNGQLSTSLNGHTAGTYTWWVRGWGSDGLGAWSGAANFDIPLPGQVTLNSPAEGATVASSTPTTFSWSASSPPAAWYLVWVNRNNSTYLSQWTQGTSLSVSAGLPAGSYTWWVEPWNTQGLGPWSSGGHFTAQ